MGRATEVVLEPSERKRRIRYYIRSEGPLQVSFLHEGNCGHGHSRATGGAVKRIVDWGRVAGNVASKVLAAECGVVFVGGEGAV